jgi:hypothetical protein
LFDSGATAALSAEAARLEANLRHQPAEASV